MPTLEKLVLPKVPSPAHILDLCCGTGQLAGALSKHGYAVTGLDGSEEMLKYASQNAPGVKFILDDARTFSLPATYDFAVSMYDSLNHVMLLEELTKVFKNVYVCLKPGGLFLFDMNMEHGYAKHWQRWFAIVEDDHVCVYPHTYDSEQRTARMDFTVFRLKDGAWWRSDFKLTQKCYSEEEIRTALKKAGFVSVQSFEHNRTTGELKTLAQDSDRAFFLCCK